MAQIGVDIDGIIANTDTAFRQRMKKVFGRDFPRHEVKQFHYETCFNFNRREMDMFFQLLLDKDLWRSISLIRGAGPTLRNLKTKHSLVLITGRPVEVKDVTQEWLEMKGIPFDELYFMQGRQKHEIAESNGYKFSLFLEDHPDYAFRMAETGVKVLLMDYPWNQGAKKHPYITRVKNWKQINDILRKNNML